MSTSLIAMLVDVAMTVTRPPTRLPKASGIRSLDSDTRILRLIELATGIRVATTPVFDSTEESSPESTVIRSTRAVSRPVSDVPFPRICRPRPSARPLFVKACPNTYIDAISTTALEENPRKPSSTSRIPVSTSAITTPSAVTS